MTPESLESQIEAAWSEMSAWPCGVFLAPTGRVIRGKHGGDYAGAELVGYYTARVKLADFRGDVFDVWETIKGRRCAG